MQKDFFLSLRKWLLSKGKLAFLECLLHPANSRRSRRDCSFPQRDLNVPELLPKLTLLLFQSRNVSHLGRNFPFELPQLLRGFLFFRFAQEDLVIKPASLALKSC